VDVVCLFRSKLNLIFQPWLKPQEHTQLLEGQEEQHMIFGEVLLTISGDVAQWLVGKLLISLVDG
jgi:hypothetical protein